jgi:hypothetical protein
MSSKKTNVKATGRKKGKIAAYYLNRWAPRKIRHMLRRNGEAFAREWANKRGFISLFLKMTGKAA